MNNSHKKTRRLVSIIITSYNEEKNILQVIKECQSLRKFFPIEIIVVDAASKDNTVKIALKAGVDRVIQFPNKRGKGADFWSAAVASNGEYIIQIDADHQFQPFEIPLFVTELEKGADVVIGTRFEGGNVEKGSVSTKNMFGNWIMSAITSLATNIRVTDVMAGFKGFRRNSLLALDLQERHFEYEAEIVVKTAKLGMSLVQIPITYKKRVGGNSGIQAIRDGFNVSKAVLKVYFSIPGQPLGKGILGKNLLKFLIPIWSICIPLITLTSLILRHLSFGEMIYISILSISVLFLIRGITGSWFSGIITSGFLASSFFNQTLLNQLDNLTRILSPMIKIWGNQQPYIMLMFVQVFIVFFIGLILEEKRLLFIISGLISIYVIFLLSPVSTIIFEVIISLLLFLLMYQKERRILLSVLVFILLKYLFLLNSNIFLIKLFDAAWLGTIFSLLFLETVSFKKRRTSLSHWRRIIMFGSIIIMSVFLITSNLIGNAYQ